MDFEFALVPIANMTLNDYHYTTSYKVQNGEPNGVATGDGWGYSTDIFLNYEIIKDTKISLGIRYQEFLMQNKDMTFNIVTTGQNVNPQGSKELALQQFGILLNLQHKF